MVLLGSGCGAPDTGPIPGVVLVVLDTARADHFGMDGYSRDTTPNFDHLASEGTWYGNAWAQAPWTLPAMATILTGQPPSVHGAGMESGRLFPLRPEPPTLAELLRGQGFQTGAVINVVFCDPASGLDRGFESYDFQTTDASNRGQRNAAATTDAALDWVGQVADRPFFLLVHYFDAHLTYDPPEPFDSMFLEEGLEAIPADFGSARQVMELRDGSIPMPPERRTALKARYDGELRFIDQEFGRLRAGLEGMGRWDNSLIVVVGDHGEEFWDHGGFEHGHSHYRELLRVPLIVHGPGRTGGGKRKHRVRQIDIVPTILQHLGFPVPQDLPGSQLGSGHQSSTTAGGSLWSGNLLSVRTDDGTLIFQDETGETRLFAADDPLEQEDLSGSRPDLLEKLGRLLPESPALRNGRNSRVPDPEELEQLRSLGYVR